MSTPSQHVTLRVPTDILERVTEHAAQRRMNRSDAVIKLIEQGLSSIGDTVPQTVSQCATGAKGLAERVWALEVAIAVTDAKGLAERVAVLEAAMAALQSNGHVTSEPRAHDQGSVPDLGERFVLGRGCNKPEHNLPTTNMTIRYKNGGACLPCKRELNRQAQERRKKSK